MQWSITVMAWILPSVVARYQYFGLVGLEFNNPVNTIKVMSSQSVYLTTLFLGSFPLNSYPVFVHIFSPETDNV